MHDGLLSAFSVLFVAYWVNVVNRVVDYQFIDEVFHVPQCQQYCAGNFSDWDPKITTPPGLYVIGWAFSRVLGLLVEKPCSLTYLRELNFIGWLAILLLALYCKKGSTTVALSPILAVYATLFYTDVWSTAFILASYAFAIVPPFDSEFASALLSALLGLVSLSFRQTNIVWNAFVAAALINRKLSPKRTFEEDLKELMWRCWENKHLLVPFAFNFAAFVAFVAWNGGVALGDKENHNLSVHAVQVFYCFTFIAGLSLPVWLSPTFVLTYLKRTFGSPQKLLRGVIELAAVAWIVHRYTIVHPFVLADNRHYTFYVWRRIIARNAWSKFVLVPLYHFSTYTVYRVLQASSLMVTAFTVCVVATLVPSPLFEPRYYILPLAFWRMQVPSHRRVPEMLFNTALLTAIFTIFINYDFPWATLSHPQRIIW